ncbi:hypothetical protein F5148DRAFT_341931 [Russula earlei]|uniref:Uncharacterized protein n=1 Tax=Russula earlei TaxID=71964 RepID=A0ACC0U1B7_9AGAM|nr:hypothetical protein F5148DRAFT_341931 [Russula earlei]
MSFSPLTTLNLEFRGRTVAVPRDDCSSHEGIIAAARRNFQPLKDVPIDDIVFMAAIPGYPLTDEVKLSKEIWPMVNTVILAVTITLKSELQTSKERCSPCSESTLLSTQSSPSKPARVFPKGSDDVTNEGQKEKKGKLSDVVQTIKDIFSSRNRPAPDPLEIREAGLLRKKISHLRGIIRIKIACIILSRRSKRMPKPALKKPVIYLYPPFSLQNVTVELLLTSSWQFSAVYPPPQTTIPYGERPTAQCLTWAVAAEPDGTLVDKTSGTEVSYLFWEACPSPKPVTPDSSRASTPIEDIKAFDPSRPSVNPADSVLLPIGKVAGYLDAALKALALHTEARTSFITYWLPDLLKHENVALRFLPQASYERSVQMRVSPTPDVVTRVFMLFRGVAAGDLGLWRQAAVRAAAEDGATFWAQVVGVDAVRASDGGLFRVLEWGGMEVV